jgi:hypothetical protein
MENETGEIMITLILLIYFIGKQLKKENSPEYKRLQQINLELADWRRRGSEAIKDSFILANCDIENPDAESMSDTVFAPERIELQVEARELQQIIAQKYG